MRIRASSLNWFFYCLKPTSLMLKSNLISACLWNNLNRNRFLLLHYILFLLLAERRFREARYFPLMPNIYCQGCPFIWLTGLASRSTSTFVIETSNSMRSSLTMSAEIKDWICRKISHVRLQVLGLRLKVSRLPLRWGLGLLGVNFWRFSSNWSRDAWLNLRGGFCLLYLGEIRRI